MNQKSSDERSFGHEQNQRYKMHQIYEQPPSNKKDIVKMNYDPAKQFKKRMRDGRLALEISPEQMFYDYTSQDEEENRKYEILNKKLQIKQMISNKIHTLHGNAKLRVLRE